MKDLSYLHPYRVKEFDKGNEDFDLTQNGMFMFVFNKKPYSVLATNTWGWEHVSVSCPYEMPTWDVMEEVKRRFFKDEEFTVEYHPKKENYVNNVENCLHMWAPMREEMPYPDMKEIKKSKPQLKEKKAFMVDGKPFSCALSEAEHYEFLTIQSGYNNRPDWGSVCKIKQQFFGDEVAFSYHGKKGDSLTKLTKDHSDSIVIWRPKDIPFPIPPEYLVGIKGYDQEDLIKMDEESRDKLFDSEYKKFKENNEHLL